MKVIRIAQVETVPIDTATPISGWTGGEVKRNLLEAAAQSIADRVLSEFPVDSVGVRVKKPHPPIRGSVIEFASVEIFRRRKE